MATTIQSGRSNSPKLTADVASRAEVYGGRGLVFDGVSDYLDCGTELGNKLGDNYSGDLTISLWMKPSGHGNDGIFNISNLANDAENFYISIYNQAIVFALNQAGWTLTLSNFTDTNWNHLVCVYKGGSEADTKMYLNGESVGTKNGTFPSASAMDFNGLKTIIGAYYSASFPFNGSMADVKIYSSALSESDIRSQYLKPESVPSPSTLVAWYPMSEANPESPQSIVYDHSEKKLGDSDWNGSVITYEADGYQFFSGISNNTLYKVQYTIATRTAGGLTFAGSSSAFGSVTLADSIGTHTYYFLSVNTTVGLRSTGFRGTITDYSAKPILMGNHATTNFFGDELVTNNGFESDGTGWTNIGSPTTSEINTN